MTARTTMQVAARVLTQVRRDHRTVALLMIVPSVLLALLAGVYDGSPRLYDRIGGTLIGIFPLMMMFNITSIAMLRERTTGTLERLMTMPLTRLDIIAGYGVAFAVLAALQATIVAVVATQWLGVDVAGELWLVIMLAVANGVLGMSLGLFVSAFAKTEFQAVQFLPAFLFPQLLVCGLFAPRESMWGPLEAISAVLPVTYAYDGLYRVVVEDAAIGNGTLQFDLAVVVGVTVLAIVAGSLTLPRRTP